ncbi:MAG: winged helix-turn-helix domain-containing protein [Pseudomonadota bacterium]
MTYVFDEFELDSERAELRRAGEVVRIEPQVFDLLHLLISAGDRVVTRDEIFSEIWGDRIVSDAALSSRIRDARKAIGDDGTTQRFIRTVQRRGLRFVGTPREQAPAVAAVPPVPCVPDPTPFDRPAVAVLPFRDLSDDSGSPALASGLTDELVAALSAWRYFPVIARNSVQRFADAGLGAEQLGDALNARYLVEGSFRRAGHRLKVQVALIDAAADYQIWSHRIVCDMGDIIDMEEDVAAQIATVIAPELEGAEARRVLRKRPDDMSAWELVMRAAWLVTQRDMDGLKEAETLALRAADRSEGWSVPMCLVAMARFQQAMAGFSASDSVTAFTSTLEAAQQAMEIDRSAWIAHALRAVGELWVKRNHDLALIHVERAIDLNPSAAMNYHFGGCITGFSGDPMKARHYQERLFRVDPAYIYGAVIEADLGLWHMLDTQYQEADTRLTRALAWDPTYGRALQRRIALSGLMDDRVAAMDAAKRMADLGLAFDAETIAASYPFRMEEHHAMFLDGLRRSGINH